MPVRDAARPPPLSERPAGCEPQPKPAANNFAPPELGVGRLLVQVTWICALLTKMLFGSPQPFQPTLEIGEFSPKFGARNELPQPPRMVRSSIGAQLNPTFGLLVPPTSLYWS